jgi:subtilisin family serine protease
MLVSSLSADSFPGREFVVDDRHLVMAGTSMSTPVITGSVALLLRRDLSLDPTGVKALLRGHSTIPGQAPMTFDPKWGWGLIDASGL